MPTSRITRTAAALATLALAAGCRNPRTDANMADAFVQFGAQLSAIQQDQAAIQGELDSLRTVVARQDTIITRLATMANLPLPVR